MRNALTLLLLLSPLPVSAQGVLVAPHAVFIDHRTRSGFVQLYNPGTEPTEVSIAALFGYPVTDSLGQLDLHTIDRPDSTMPSAVGWIQAFPRRTVIQPLARQTIRLLVTPPEGVADGEYWARLAISAKGSAVPVSGADTTRGITVGLNLEVRTIIPLLYRKGAVTTSLAVSGLRAERAGDSLVVRARLARSGTASYLGTVRGELVSPAGRTAAKFDMPISVYYDLDPRFTIPAAGLVPGEYLLRFWVTAERSDIAAAQTLKAPTVRDSIRVQIR
ncbi:MAG TPA: hypothetical protein VJU15_05295 [Gemmatimonadales bacterium]|nr:hypothetical protein [Gemmatimonadales bacterium]